MTVQKSIRSLCLHISTLYTNITSYCYLCKAQSGFMLLWLKRWKTVLCSPRIGKNWNAFPESQAKLAALLSHGSDSSSSSSCHWMQRSSLSEVFLGLFALPAFQSIDLIVFADHVSFSFLLAIHNLKFKLCIVLILTKISSFNLSFRFGPGPSSSKVWFPVGQGSQ